MGHGANLLPGENRSPNVNEVCNKFYLQLLLSHAIIEFNLWCNTSHLPLSSNLLETIIPNFGTLSRFLCDTLGLDTPLLWPLVLLLFIIIIPLDMIHYQ